MNPVPVIVVQRRGPFFPLLGAWLLAALAAGAVGTVLGPIAASVVFWPVLIGIAVRVVVKQTRR